MTLTARISSRFAGEIRERGRSYFRTGRVTISEGSCDYVLAQVLGSTSYAVQIIWENRELTVHCNCPYFESEEGPCKHIWGALLAAEAAGHLSALPKSGNVRMVSTSGTELDDNTTWDLGGSDESDEPGPDDESSFRPPARQPQRASGSRVGVWRDQIEGLRLALHNDATTPLPAAGSVGEILYVLNIDETIRAGGLVLDICERKARRDSDRAQPVPRAVRPEQINWLPDESDRRIWALLLGAADAGSTGWTDGWTGSSRFVLAQYMRDIMLPVLCETGRCCLRRAADPNALLPVTWDGGPPWELRLDVCDEAGKYWVLTGSLVRGDRSMPLQEPLLLLAGGLVFTQDRVARLADHGAFPWVVMLRRDGALRVPTAQQDLLLESVWNLPWRPPIAWPAALQLDEVPLAPRPHLTIRPGRRDAASSGRLRAELGFLYDDVLVRFGQPGDRAVQISKRRLIVRDRAAEQPAYERLLQLGFRVPPSYTCYAFGQPRHDVELTPRHLPEVVPALVAAGWHVEAEGKIYRSPGEFQIEVRSGVNWFELDARIEFGDRVCKLPELLAAIRRGQNTVVLDDGTMGMLPETWLKKYALLLSAGTVHDDHVRFGANQVGVLDVLLSSQASEVSCDALFEKARAELRRFDGVQAADPPDGFVGALRPYQRDGLGWMEFLRRFQFGGCLADDMGLGKTVQVLALLEARRQLRSGDAGGKRSAAHTAGRPGPSLVVVPKSLVFNWKSEAARFAPKIRVLDHTGISRVKTKDHFDDFDLILTTYGTLRRDVKLFREVQFDYLILDEAQAIKNAQSESAKAARLLVGQHRLALSGTPIENHIGELWSLFEFLNPGMLGASAVFQAAVTPNGRGNDHESRALIARSLRPFMLRRTKQQVAKDLPEKLEQTLLCDLDAEQRKQYDDLRDFYRAALLGKIQREGLAKSKIQVLEALMRLRQAACHPGLIDKRRTNDSSAKLDLLLEQLADVRAGGHKALVFSQFTSFLAILRERLDQEQVPYEYLDGRTRDRSTHVERFQTDPHCPLFLISLKAGGVGLNLTAAEYIFLLDPWWNPAVEAQAIDRAHRIGQTCRVFAYRLIARQTVEEKVLELQQSKRELADAIINADNNMIRNMTREDLELLLS